MSVYTVVTTEQLKQFLAGYDLGELEQFVGISNGIENTNYFVTTSTGDYVLTLFEVLQADELPYFLELMAFLAEHDIPSAHPVPDRNGMYLQRLNGKPAALVQRLNGASVDLPTPTQCRAIGEQMARMHVACDQFGMHRDPVRGPKWWVTTAAEVMPKLSHSDQALLRAELEFQAAVDTRDLPFGIIHADLFRDNALFVGERLTGIIDFYYACNFYLIYDLAVTVNDWCNSGDSAVDSDNAAHLLGGYQRFRTVTPREIDVWPAMLRGAALRFWLSRLRDMHFPRPGEITHIKDPNVFRDVLTSRIGVDDELRAMWQTAVSA
ncbi:homoserine kinase type II [Methylohalomonas lacus]|uniref:Homoserine kinase n=1 Tax=Methylohalomonas lacus TaxID=398773 RepID=A0AAE3HMS9_9GAMM|nr:homoserine kinase [Methylohalomonas lacus]MCS3904218.1 homoserine kinase type II [Methylohalomonas lacus]